MIPLTIDDDKTEFIGLKQMKFKIIIKVHFRDAYQLGSPDISTPRPIELTLPYHLILISDDHSIKISLEPADSLVTGGD